MNIVRSHPTSKGGGSLETAPLTGVAHVIVADRIFKIRLENASIEQLSIYRIDGVCMGDGTVWFEDARERSH